jgi:hypothetical protein
MLAIFSPFQVKDLFSSILSFLNPVDIVHSAKVCKFWNHHIKGSASIWIKISEAEGIPLVDGEGRNRREDF